MSWVISALLWLWATFKGWLYIFIAPLKDFNMLWIIIPIYLNWIFTEIYQEKRGTSFGNAISNGVVVLWVGIDWARTIINHGVLSAGWAIFFVKLAISILAFVYGIIIIVEGIKAKNITHYIGRIREVTYFCLMFTPIFYLVVQPTFTVFIGIILFFPLFYGLFELVDKITPTPKVYEFDEGKSSEMPPMEDFGKNEKLDDFNFNEPVSSQQQPSQFPQQNNFNNPNQFNKYP